jgi:inner membrane protein
LDSLTQLTLGAAVGEAVLGRQIGNRAILWGAICGTLPDLDVFIPFGDAVRDFTYHRSFSHSLFVLAALTPVLVWLIRRIHPTTAHFRHRWCLLVFLAFLTHILLDCFTVYGTQIFWPLWNYPVSGSAIFIIDPAYTLPLLGGVLSALIMTRRTHRGHVLNRVGLSLSSAYLVWVVAAKAQVEQVAHESLTQQGLTAERVLTTPGPLNSVLWRIVAMDGDGYYEGFYSLLDDTPQVHFSRYPSQTHLLRDLQSHWPVKRLQWFTHGFYSVHRDTREIIMSDLRMGLEPHYFFRFKVGEIGNPHAVPVPNERVVEPRRYPNFVWLWRRIWSADIATPSAS